jgi:hypothetical protein
MIEGDVLRGGAAAEACRVVAGWAVARRRRLGAVDQEWAMSTFTVAARNPCARTASMRATRSE